MALPVRSFLYALCLIILHCMRYIFIVFRVDSVVPIILVVLRECHDALHFVPAFTQIAQCIPKSQAILISGYVLISSRHHIVHGFHTICGWVLSQTSLAVLFLLNVVASDTLHVPLSWNHLRSAIEPLATFVAVTKRNFCGQAIPPEWLVGSRKLLRLALPWLLRVTVAFLVICRCTPVDRVNTNESNELLSQDSQPQREKQRHLHSHTIMDPAGHQCIDFHGKPLQCSKLDQVRHFNRFVMPTLKDAHYDEVRRRMSLAGLNGLEWHVGHAIPDPSKTMRDEEDFGWNLFCQGARDNRRLGHRLVSCSEASHWGVFHVRCAKEA